MKAWRLDRLGGELRLEDAPMPQVRPGSVPVRIEASTLTSYLKPHVEGRLPSYRVLRADLRLAAIVSASSRRSGRTSGDCRSRPRTVQV